MKFRIGLKTLCQKIVVIGMLQMVVVAVVLLELYAHNTKSQAIQQQIEKARAIVLNAESTREEMGRKWKLGLFNKENMIKWAQQGLTDKLLAAIPVVTAWNAAMSKSKEGDYQFKVPKMSPRNPKNTPDDLETRALHAFKDQHKVVKQVNDFSRTIASAVEEQSATTQEISRNIAQTAQATEVVSSNIDEMAIAASEITGNIVKVDANAKINAQNASETHAAGETLNQLSQELHELTQHFTV